jgi:small nuclear ribonucleoprotein (snRNP)-like protein
MSSPSDSDMIAELVGTEVVIDVASPYVYAGTLVGYDHAYLVLEEADAHDLRDTTTTRDVYVLDTKRLGVRANRKRVLVARREIVGVSALADVIE